MPCQTSGWGSCDPGYATATVGTMARIPTALATVSHPPHQATTVDPHTSLLGLSVTPQNSATAITGKEDIEGLQASQ